MAIATLVGASVTGAPAVVSPLVIPTREAVEQAAELAADLLGYDYVPDHWRLSGAGHAGIHRVRPTEAFYLEVTPGTVALRRKLPRPYEAHDDWRDTPESVSDRRQREIWDEWDEDPRKPEPRVITEWSRRSRARLAEAIGATDFEPWLDADDLALLTLTLPNGWRKLAPRGKVFKAMVERFRVHWTREFGEWSCIWKLEFQERGAPHMHLLLRVPRHTCSGERVEFWAARTWAHCVGAPEGSRDRRLHEIRGIDVDRSRSMGDVARIAKYFMGHSSKKADGKEYQHIVPREWSRPGDGPGRFWGISGLKSLRIRVEIDAQDFWAIRRMLRGVHRGRRASIALSRRSHAVRGLSEATRVASLHDLSTFGLKRDRLLTSSGGGGWVLSDDAPGLVVQLATHQRTSLRSREGP